MGLDTTHFPRHVGSAIVALAPEIFHLQVHANDAVLDDVRESLGGGVLSRVEDTFCVLIVVTCCLIYIFF